MVLLIGGHQRSGTTLRPKWRHFGSKKSTKDPLVQNLIDAFRGAETEEEVCADLARIMMIIIEKKFMTGKVVKTI